MHVLSLLLCAICFIHTSLVHGSDDEMGFIVEGSLHCGDPSYHKVAIQLITNDGQDISFAADIGHIRADGIQPFVVLGAHKVESPDMELSLKVTHDCNDPHRDSTLWQYPWQDLKLGKWDVFNGVIRINATTIHL